MKWSSAAENAVSKVPFFVRKKVRKRVEEEALRCGADEVSIEHVNASKKRFLSNMEDEVKGFQVETCFGQSGCPNRAFVHDDLHAKITALLESKDIPGFLRRTVKGKLKLHHEFRVSISDCPNACSRPQIVDVGIIGARAPRITNEECTRCGVCVDVCREHAVTLPETEAFPIIDTEACLYCGQCIEACPTGTIAESAGGYRILLGGKLGRHPQLGRELKGIYSPQELIDILNKCVDFHMSRAQGGERFGEVLNRIDIKDILA